MCMGRSSVQSVWDWAGFQALPQSREVSDIHCVTTWSRYDNAWDGVLTRDLLQVVHPRPEAHLCRAAEL